MKKIFLSLLWSLSCLEICAQLGYRYEGEFIQLIPKAAEPYYVQTYNTESQEHLKKMANMEIHQIDNDSKVYMISENSFFVSSKPSLLEKVYISEMFQDTKGNPYYILPRIILSLNDNAHISDVIKRYSGILELDSIQRLKGMTTLECNLSSAHDVLRVVRELDRFEEVKWCEPDMICKWEMQDSDPLFPLQYYMQNNSTGNYDINAVPAWEIITGSANITVSVIDEGVDPDHEDLSGNVLQGYTIGDATGYGLPQNANTTSVRDKKVT